MPNKNIQNTYGTIREMLQAAGALYKKQTAIEQKAGGSYIGYSYARLCEDAKKLGSALYKKLGSGAHVMLIGENGYELVISYLAVTSYVGAVVPMPVSAGAQNVSDAAKLCDVKAIIYGDAAKDSVLAFDDDIEKIKLSELSELIASAGECDIPAPAADDVAELLYTYGSEESARAAVLTHKNICFSISEMAQTLPLSPEDKLYSVLPTAYSYERICGTLYPLSRGACVAYGEGLRHLSTNLRVVRPTVMLCVPLILDRIYGKIWANIEKKGIGEKVRRAIKLTEAAGPLRTAVRRSVFAEIHDSLGGRLAILLCGGGTPSAEAVYGLREFGIRALASYGHPESAALVCANRRDLHEYTSVGMPVPGVLVDIYNMRADGVGEVRCKGENITKGYYKNEELTRETLRDGWFYTGDMGYFDRRGFLHTVGKKSNMIVLSKRRTVFPEELEAKLCESPFVSGAVVAAVKNAERGEYDIVALIEPNRKNLEALYGENMTDAQLSAEIQNVIETVNSKTEQYKNIVRTVIVNEGFEKNEEGTVLRSKITLD